MMMQGQEQVPHDTSTEGATELQSADHQTSDILPTIVSEVNDVIVQGLEAETNRRTPSNTQIYRPDLTRQKG